MATPEPAQVVFSHSVESVFQRALGGEVPLALEDRLRRLGLDQRKPLLSSDLEGLTLTTRD